MARPAAEAKPEYRVEALAKGLRLLGLFTEQRPTWRVTDLAEAAGLPMPTAYRVVQTLTGRVESTRGEHGEIEQELHQLQMKVAELRVRAAYREGEILGEIVAGDPQMLRLRELTQAAGREADALRLQLGEAVARALTARRRYDADAISAALLSHAHDAVVEEPRTEYELLRASYLVDRRRMSDFDECVDEIARRERDRMSFGYTGPLPPHSFVSLSPGRT